MDRITGSNSTGEAAGDSWTSIERFYLSANNDRFVGNTDGEFIFAGAGNDTIIAGAGDDWLIGEAGGDSLDGGAGYDSVTYGDAASAIIVDRNAPANNSGDAAGDSFVSIERFYMSGFADQYVGDANADVVDGGNGNDTINGAGGNDVITGGSGDDSLSGGTGNDVFVFAAGFGKDTIVDFSAGSGVADIVSLSLGTAFDTFAEVLAATTQVGANSLITIDANTTITLQNIQKTALVVDDFQFI
ncbi:MAG: hypothetical protein K2Z25_18390 [Beijerinckiaceae bacterium]|nr:hypothetical protein [Beijerinckiaceae bacterium]